METKQPLPFLPGQAFTAALAAWNMAMLAIILGTAVKRMQEDQG